MTDGALLELEQIQVRIAGKLALTDVSLRVRAGTCLGLVGETGCGKSLTCRLVTGLLERIGGRVVHGRARFDGHDLLAGDAAWRGLRGARIGLVPQGSLSALDPLMRVGSQMEETIRTLDPDAAPRERARELLDQVQLPRADEILRLFPHELSGGMRQRVMIALALAGRPDLLVADEPTTALDVTVQRGIVELLDELRERTGLALIIVTHDLGVVQSVTEEVAIMYAGAVVESGRTAEVLAAPAHPYTRALIAARPTVAQKGRRLLAIPGAPPGLADRPSGCPFAPRCAEAIDRCREQVPVDQQVAAGHVARCWRVGERVEVPR
jgi:oligopeptide/dipeptide ABC transporter ATP-binding protein